MFREAQFTEDHKLIRPSPTRYDFEESEIAYYGGQDARLAQQSVEHIVQRYGSNPLSYPQPVFRTYFEVLRHWN